MLKTSIQNTAWAPRYAASMGMRATTAIRAIVAANTKALMERRGWSQAALARKAGVSQTQIGYVVREETDTSIWILEALGKAFGIPAWLLLVPDLSPDVLDSSELPTMVSRYADFAASNPRRPRT